jgi:long-chain acyl-CoA synthetase
VPGVEVRVAEDSEILVRGPNVMRGYLERPDLTASAIDGAGWFHTGDLGTMDRDGFLTITGRKKDLFKLSTGEYVAPEALEAHYRASRFIDQIMIVGENRKYVAALIVPSFSALADWYRSRHMTPPSPSEMVADPQVRSLIADELSERGEQLGRSARIRRFELLAYQWSVQNGALSPTLKLRRGIIAEHHAAEIERCFPPHSAATSPLPVTLAAH